MKPSVLVATQDSGLRTGIRTHLADICNVSSTSTVGNLLAALSKKDYQALVLDTRMPDFDGPSLLHALRHHGDPNLIVLSTGAFEPTLVLGAQEILRLVPIPLSPKSTILRTLRAFLDPASSRSMENVRYQPNEGRFFITFRNWKSYEISRGLIEADDGTPIVGEPEVIHGGEAFRVGQRSGNRYEVPWDFVLYHQEPSYPYYRGKPGQREAEANRAERIAARIRNERQARGWSLQSLASVTGIQPPNLSRLESGKHVPSLETLERIAGALGMRVAGLIAQ
ncbi:MAG: hypothetical protein A3G35_02270 [candidate division NC10 bacterium RIFCSPLOWO2_12_FULL_66_18]|nr:MAG: hypothetical protein A3G35_02270 [candidate division NC10 bacterium RIFCSPLOWO2_12_FULL_66_18]